MKEKILKKSLEMVKKEGLNAFSMRRLAGQLRVDPMTIYYYFKNKDELIAEMVEVIFSKFSKSVQLRKIDGGGLDHICLLLMEYRNFFILNVDLSLYLIQSSNRTYRSVELLNQYFLEKIVFSNPKENPEITRDILIDFVHGNALASSFQFQKNSKLKSLRLQKVNFDKSIRILVQQLFQ